jgi:outer membrane lipoprotein-sorting protein
MKTRLALLLCTLLAAAPAFAAGKNKSPSPSGMTAQQIVDRNVEARGGLKAWHAVHTMRMTGKIDAGHLRTKPPVPLYATSKATRARYDFKAKAEPAAPVVQLPFVMNLKRPNKMRFELEFEGDTAIQAYDGANGWKLRPFLGRHEIEPFTTEEMKTASQQQDLDGFLIDYTAKGSKVESEGLDKVNGHDAYKLRVTLKDGQERHVWVDAKNFLDVKIDGSRRMDGKPRAVSTYFSNYKTVKGLKVPFTMETVVEGVSGSEKISIKEVALNPPLADSAFARPNN